jgi:hypothetical protein
MDLLTWPNVTLDQFHELIPALAHLEPSSKEHIMIEGMMGKEIRIEKYGLLIFQLCCVGRYKPFLKRQEM